MSGLKIASTVDDIALAIATPSDALESKVIDTPYRLFTFPFARTTTAGVRKGIVPSVNKNN